MTTNTLVATFDDYNTASQAARELENAGVPAGDITLDSNRKTAGAGSYQNEEYPKSGFTHWWNSLFGTDNTGEELRDYDNQRRGYEGTLERGGTILRATVPDNLIDTAVTVLNRKGAVNLEDPRQTAGVQEGRLKVENRVAGEGRPIRIIDEELQVGKRSIVRGGVRVYTHVVTEPIEKTVQLREEHVKVERRPVNREVNPSDVGELRDQTIEVTETVEEPVVAKRARVREEIVVGKEATERTETVRDNVRHTEVRVENLGGDVNRDVQDPGFEYGYRSAGDPRFTNRSWEQAERDLRTDYERSYPGGRWDEVKNSIRNGWEKATGKR